MVSKEKLNEQVSQGQNVVTLSMESVRDAWGFGRLGVHVRSQISDDLRGMGIGHYPSKLPEYQEQDVRLYRLGTPVAHVIDAVLNPSAESDERLREAAGGNARETVEAIKALVCE